MYRTNQLNFYKIALSGFWLILLFFVNDLFTGNTFGQKLFLNLSAAFTVYWTISIFIFLFKRSLYTSFTVVIQRYWKRALYLFWILELFLFAIYTYLILVAPTEVEWLLDQPQLFLSNWWDGSLFFNKLLPILAIILMCSIISFLLINLNHLALILCILLVTVLLSTVVWSDTAQTFLYSIYYSGLSWEYDGDSYTWLLNSDVDKVRCVTHYIFLITILKFWHTMFIAATWLITTMFSLQSPYIGQGAFAANKQNMYFLYGFAFIWTCFLYKSYMNISYEYVYSWFFVNIWEVQTATFEVLLEPLWALF